MKKFGLSNAVFTIIVTLNLTNCFSQIIEQKNVMVRTSYFGKSELINGVVKISLTQDLKDNLTKRSSSDYFVSFSPFNSHGELYLIEKTKDYFIVKSDNESSVIFEYLISFMVEKPTEKQEFYFPIDKN